MDEVILYNKIFRKIDSTYYVSKDGDIYSTYSKKLLKWGIDKDGYPRVDIHGKHRKIHQLVYLTWVGPIPKGLQINHKDDNKQNPSLDNLYVGTQAQNIQDCISNKHRVGNVWHITVEDKKVGKILTFSPAQDFIKYDGHPCGNGSVKRWFKRSWFKERYRVLEFKLGKV